MATEETTDPSPQQVAQNQKLSGAKLSFHHALGCRFPPGRCLEHLNEDTVSYLVGKHVAEYEHESCRHTIAKKGPKIAEIICFCISPNRKYVALAERSVEATLQVNIYTVHGGTKVRSLEFKYLSKLPVVSMDFSTDNKYLATVTALPEVFIYLWQVDKSKLVGMVEVQHQLTRITISPWAHWWLCTTGPSTLKLWRLQDKQLKLIDPMPKRKDGTAAQAYRFTCQAWYDEEKLVTGTEEGDILVVENSEVKKTLRVVHGEGYAISAICNLQRGFLCGGDGGLISLFERTYDESTYFRLLKRFTPPHHARVMDISASPKEESMVACFQNNTLAMLPLENVEFQKEVEGVGLYNMLAIGFHYDTVTCVDVCVQRALIVTGSLDKTVRVWNFAKRCIEFIKTFDEEVISLALHPTGLRMIIGFKSYMRMYNVLSNDLHFCTEFPVKPCYEIRFSHGGQYFAAVVAHRVLIFNSYDFTIMQQLQGHNVVIRTICWSPNDQYISSADLNGVLSTFQVDPYKKLDTEEGSGKKNVCYCSIAYDDNLSGTAAYGVCHHGEGGMAEGEVTVRCIVPGQETRVARPNCFVSKLPAQRKQHTQEIALSTVAQTLFVGCPTGNLLLYRWPLQEDAQPYQKLELHNGEITFVVLSRDERYLFTIGDDNSMFMLEMEALLDGKAVGKKPFNYSAFDDVCYTLQSEVDERLREIAHLNQKHEDLTAQKERERNELTQKYAVEMASKDEEASSNIDFLKKSLSQSTKQKEEADQNLIENARHLETMHLKAAEELEALYTKRTEEANARYQQLKTEREDLIVRYENKLFKMQKEQDAERKKLEDKVKETEQKLGSELESLKRKLNATKTDGNDMLNQCILDYDQEVDELHGKYKQIIQKKEEDLNKAINNGSTGERDANRLKEQRDLLIKQLEARDDNINDLTGNVDKRKKENESLRKEMLVRFESISTAEKKIQQLKKQTTELEKLRYVLTFKFNELKKEVAPKDKQIGFLNSRVEEMDSELEKVALDREALKQELKRKEDKLKVLQTDIGGQQKLLNDKERVINTMLKELTELVGNTDTKKLVYELRDVVTRYNTKQQREEVIVEEDRTAEFERQREYMEAQLACVKRQNRQKEGNLRLDNQRNTAENAILVKEINELRHEKKLLTTKCQVVESQLKDARLALQRATAASSDLQGTTGGISAVGSKRSPTRSPMEETQDFGATVPGSRKGKLIRGSTRALRDIAQLDSDKIARIIAQVEKNNAEMERQQEEILRLREFVSHLLTRAESNPSALSSQEQSRQSEIRQHLQTTMTPAPVPET